MSRPKNAKNKPKVIGVALKDLLKYFNHDQIIWVSAQYRLILPPDTTIYEQQTNESQQTSQAPPKEKLAYQIIDFNQEKR